VKKYLKVIGSSALLFACVHLLFLFLVTHHGQVPVGEGGIFILEYPLFTLWTFLHLPTVSNTAIVPGMWIFGTLLYAIIGALFAAVTFGLAQRIRRHGSRTE
jgi:hypothetical protein